MTFSPNIDSRLSFADYIQQCQSTILAAREDLNRDGADVEKILRANSPFEYHPEQKNIPLKAGALLIHGLLDCPFTFREMGSLLQDQGILARAILLPGHGTRPSDLLHVTYHDWLQAVRLGIESLLNEVDTIFLIGYSTGAALSIYHALQDNRINGLVLLAPAIKIRTPVDVLVNWYHLTNCLGKDRDWVFRAEEDDYAKYKSITFNGVKQVAKLTESIREMCSAQKVQQPMYMILSRVDETISSQEAIELFSATQNPQNQLLLYTAKEQTYPDSRIVLRQSEYPDLDILELSHAALSYSTDNPHYGQNGDYINAAHQDKNVLYGAYNRIEMNAFDLMAKYGIAKHSRRSLTYNPDFNYLVTTIISFMMNQLNKRHDVI